MASPVFHERTRSINIMPKNWCNRNHLKVCIVFVCICLDQLTDRSACTTCKNENRCVLVSSLPLDGTTCVFSNKHHHEIMAKYWCIVRTAGSCSLLLATNTLCSTHEFQEARTKNCVFSF